MKTSEMIRDAIKLTLDYTTPESTDELIDALRPKFRRLEKAINDETGDNDWARLFDEDIKGEENDG